MRRRQDPALFRASADFIRGFAAWNTIVHLTFGEDVSFAVARRLFRLWARMIAGGSQDHVAIAWAEDAQTGGRPHYHVLLQLRELANYRFQWLALAWSRVGGRQAGDCLAEDFEDGIEGPSYLVEHARWEVNVLCHRPASCRRSGGPPCRVAGVPFSP